MDVVPGASLLNHVPSLEVNSGIPPVSPQCTLQTERCSTRESGPGTVLFGAGFPPVPSKLVKKIEAGDFIDMAKLRPEGLGTMEDSAPGRSTKGKTKMISNILEWIRCFSLYVAILSRSAPHRVPDLLSYQALIIEAQMEYPGDHWLGYDRRFRQRAAVTKTTKWSKIDTTLWHLAFAGRPSIARCKYCFSVTHCSSDCELAPDPDPPAQEQPAAPSRRSTAVPSRPPVCFAWNEDPSRGCTRKNCKFEHICYICAKDPSIRNKNHKAVRCPHRGPARPQPSTSK